RGCFVWVGRGGGRGRGRGRGGGGSHVRCWRPPGLRTRPGQPERQSQSEGQREDRGEIGEQPVRANRTLVRGCDALRSREVVGRAAVWDRFWALHQAVNALPGRRRDACRLAEHQGQDLVARRDLGKVDILLEAGLLDLRKFLGGERAVEVLCDRI